MNVIPDKVYSKINQNCAYENSKYYIKAVLWPEDCTNESTYSIPSIYVVSINEVKNFVPFNFDLHCHSIYVASVAYKQNQVNSRFKKNSIFVCNYLNKIYLDRILKKINI